MRASVPGLMSPFPLHTYLPAILQEDQFTPRLTAGLDDVLAPVISTLDCLPAYLDPEIAPRDVLRWLGTWVGVEWDPAWPVGKLRDLMATLSAGYADRGTVAGLRSYLAAFTGAQIDIVDSGGATYSQTPTEDEPETQPYLVVRATMASDTDTTFLIEELLDDLVASEKAAHVSHRVELVRVEEVFGVAT